MAKPTSSFISKGTSRNSRRIKPKLQRIGYSLPLDAVPGNFVAGYKELVAKHKRGKATRDQSPEEIIRGLAAKHGVTPERTELDDMADDFARLSDAEVEPDELADLVVTLKRKGILTADEAVKLYAQHVASQVS
ncbi:conserved protein [Tepidicaulis marinus]|uniref:Conserved protein n=1 Tax=Tepidicaulis marinus TaxID=1333998 RepID=A0A081BF25_9HYPH|nr:hypothetical protein [Tepidicaulis marinus]GAK46643.1 conserved protein [Tepidicaulis marinus]